MLDVGDDHDTQPLIEYARCHGLTHDHQAVHPILNSECIVTPPPDDIILSCLDDPNQAPPLTFPGTSYSLNVLKEKLSASKDVARLLLPYSMAHTSELPLRQSAGKNGVDTLVDEYDHRHIKRLKMESPILRRSVNDQNLRGSSRPHIEPDLARLNLPFEIVDDDEEDEDHNLKAYFQQQIAEQLKGRIENEKLSVSKDVLKFMQYAICGSSMTAQEEQSFGEEMLDQVRATAEPSLRSKKGGREKRLTSPLLPRSSSPTLFHAHSPIRLPDIDDDIWGPESDGIEAEDLAELDKSLTLNDAPSVDTPKSAIIKGPSILLDPDSLLRDGSYDDDEDELITLPSAPLSMRNPTYASKIDGPLTPTRHEDLVVKETTIQQLIMPFLPPTLPRKRTVATDTTGGSIAITIKDRNPASTITTSSSSDSAAFINTRFQSPARQTSRHSAQEQVCERDSASKSLRMPVPTMDFSPPRPPWQVHLHQQDNHDNHADRLPHPHRARLHSSAAQDETQWSKSSNEPTELARSTPLDISQTTLSKQMGLISEVKQIHMARGPAASWSGSRSIEKQLRWLPFSLGPWDALGDDGLDGDVKGAGAVEGIEEMLQRFQVEDIWDGDGLAWKHKGLGILVESESESNLNIDTVHDAGAIFDANGNAEDRDGKVGEEKEPKKMQDGTVKISSPREDLSTLVRRKKRLLDESTLANSKVKHPRVDTAETTEFSILDSSFSATESIDAFIATRGNKIQKRTAKQSSYFSTPTKSKTAGVPTSFRNPNPVTCPAAMQKIAFSSTPDTPSLPMPRSPRRDLPRRAFIVSSTLWTQCSILRRLRVVYPAAELIERDFSSRAMIGSQWPTSSRRDIAMPSPSVAAAMAINPEADLLLSPSTGLICTTLQKIKQRALPGQKEKTTALRERIMQVHVRYERLVVLVSEGLISTSSSLLAPSSLSSPGVGGNSDERHMLGEMNGRALAELKAFVAPLGCDVQVEYVCGGEEMLVDRMVDLMARCHVEDSTYRLMHDETPWELSLCRAGMNAFAAQVLLLELGPQWESLGTSAEEGLQKARAFRFGFEKFVSMAAEQRVDELAIVLGGSRVISRVSAVIDAQYE
ncbi:MAG: hypothetical protein M1825_003196 [Sarcosagium campestre]|nr:MAG: hypothetical protein M1825_003196 [Sarcosagium campestre]